MKDLSQCRAEIDAIDMQIVSLFEKRMQAARDVAAYKHAHQMNILDISREQAVLQSRAALAKDEALRPTVIELFKTLMALSREEQRKYLDSLSHSDIAAGTDAPDTFCESADRSLFSKD